MKIEKVIIISSNTKKEFENFSEATVYADKFHEKNKREALKFKVKVDDRIINLSDADSFLYTLDYDMGSQEEIKEALETIKARVQDLETLLNLEKEDFKTLRNQFDRAQFGELYEEDD